MRANGSNTQYAVSVAATSASQLAIVVLSFGTAVAQARLLEAEGRGELARFVNVGALAVLYLGLGISSGITYFVASGATTPHDLARPLGRALIWTTLAVVLITGVVAVTPLGRFLPGYGAVAAPAAAIGLYFVFAQAGGWVTAVLAAQRDFRAINLSAITVSVAGFAASAVLLWLHPSWAGPWAIIALLVLLEAIRTIMLAASYSRSRRMGTREGAAGTAHAPASIRHLWGYSALSFIADALQFMTYRFDMWVVDAFHGGAELGRYALAVSLAQLVWVVPSAAGRVLFPWVAKMDRGAGAQLAWRSAWVALVISSILALGGWWLSTLSVTTIFGKTFEGVPTLIGILLLGVVPYSFARVLSNYLAGVNAVGVNAVASGVILAVAVTLAFAWIPDYAALGAAWATAVAYGLHTVMITIIFLVKTRRDPAQAKQPRQP